MGHLPLCLCDAAPSRCTATRYAENLKRDLPRIPLLPAHEMFATCVRVGKALMDLHLNYETAKEYRLPHVETKGMQTNWAVKKMKLTTSKDAVIVNEWLTLTGVPQECFEYRLGNRSALEWGDRPVSGEPRRTKRDRERPQPCR